MNEAQTATLEDEDVNELDWRIYAPKTRHLDIAICNETWNADQPRLWLMDGEGEDSPERDILHITVDRETFGAKSWPHWGGPAARLGTWKRYHDDASWLKAFLEQLSWTLTDEERALVDALNEYGQQAPERYVTAA